MERECERERIDGEFVANTKQKLKIKCARVRHFIRETRLRLRRSAVDVDRVASAVASFTSAESAKRYGLGLCVLLNSSSVSNTQQQKAE